MTLKQREAFVLSLEVLRVAIKCGWNVKIFKEDSKLSYLGKLLRDTQVNCDVFFEFDEFIENNRVRSAYDWARKVQGVAFEGYDIRDTNRRNFLHGLEVLDRAYEDGYSPKKMLNEKDLMNLDISCTEFINEAYSIKPFYGAIEPCDFLDYE